MSEEYVDMVDEKDNVIGQELISKVHAEKICHRGASIICFKDKTLSDILLNKRGPKKRVCPGRLCIPGGHPSAGEPYARGAIREFREEVLGSNKTQVALEPLFKIRKETDGDPEFMTVFRTVYAGPFVLNKGVSDCYFENIRTTLERIKKEPELYTETTALILREYEKRYLKTGNKK